MILYYTGTGNSEYVAKKIAEQTEDEVMNLFERIRKGDYSGIHSEKPFVVVYPTYAWQMPHILEDYIRRTSFSGNKQVYFVTTCGAGMGNMPKYIENLCGEKGFSSMGCAEIVMPENYIAVFQAPDREKAIQIIRRADTAIRKVTDHIRHNQPFPGQNISLAAKLSSGLVNRLFYSMIISAGKFYATDACTGCGKCTRVCPLDNIKLNSKKPEWGSRCTHCMACICKCPAEAIEYGKRSKGKPRYQCPL